MSRASKGAGGFKLIGRPEHVCVVAPRSSRTNDGLLRCGAQCLVDNPAQSTNSQTMPKRLIALLAALATAIVTTAASAHVTQISNAPDRELHPVLIMQTMDGGDMPCANARHTDAAMAGFCGFLCTGLAEIVASPSSSAGFAALPADRSGPPAPRAAGMEPELAKPPPKNRHL